MSKFTVKVYTTKTCPWCVKAKDYLKAHKIKFEELDVTSNEKARNDMVQKSGQMGVPVIEVAKEGAEPAVIVGFDEEALQNALEIK